MDLLGPSTALGVRTSARVIPFPSLSSHFPYLKKKRNLSDKLDTISEEPTVG